MCGDCTQTGYKSWVLGKNEATNGNLFAWLAFLSFAVNVYNMLCHACHNIVVIKI